MICFAMVDVINKTLLNTIINFFQKFTFSNHDVKCYLSFIYCIFIVCYCLCYCAALPSHFVNKILNTNLSIE